MHDTGYHPQNNQGKDDPGAPAAYSGPRFRTILADPPWDTHQRGPLGASRHYDLMTLDQIRGLPVAQLAQPDAHLWLWVTNATLRAGYDLAEAWGFTPRSPLTWIKPRFTLGNYLRNATEHLILATRGRAPWHTTPSRPGCSRPSRTTPTSPRSSSPSSSGSATDPTSSSSPDATHPATGTGPSGATRSPRTSTSPATPYHGTAREPDGTRTDVTTQTGTGRERGQACRTVAGRARSRRGSGGAACTCSVVSCC